MNLDSYLAQNHGVISKTDALAFGLTAHQITYRTRSKRWLVFGPGLYQVAASPKTWWSGARASALASQGLVSHRSALRVWGVDGYVKSKRIDVTVDERRRVIAPPNSRLHRSIAMDLADTRLLNGIPTTGIGRAVLDVASMAGDSELDQIIDAVVRARLTTISELLSVVNQHGRQGRAGAGRLVALLQQRQPQERVPDSRFNRLVGQLLVRSGLPEPIYEYEIRCGSILVGRADLAYPAHGLLIECDSARWHHNRQSFEADPRRRNRLLMAGYQVVNFTWSDYRRRPEVLVATVRAMLGTEVRRI